MKAILIGIATGAVVGGIILALLSVIWIGLEVPRR